MESMSGLSRMFINLESERFALDGASILALDPSTAPGGHDYQRVRIQLAAADTRDCGLYPARHRRAVGRGS